MKAQIFSLGISTTILASAIAIAAAVATYSPPAAAAADCPNGGTVRFGVEPFDTAAKLVPIYDHIGKLLGDKIGCRSRSTSPPTTTPRSRPCATASWKSASSDRSATCWRIRSPRRRRSPRSATRTASPITYWASLVTYPARASRRWPRSAAIRLRSPIRPRPPGICSRPMGCARPASIRTRTSSAIYAGSHTSSFEALYNHKVDAGELNSEQLAVGDAARPLQGRRRRLPVEVRSDPDRSDHRARRSCRRRSRQRLTDGAADSRLDELAAGSRPQDHGSARHHAFVPQTDGAYDRIRDLVKTLQHRSRQAELSLR